MLTQISPLATDRRLHSGVIPIVENRGKLEQALHVPNVDIILLRHCNPLEFITLLDRAHQRSLQVYVNVDHIGGYRTAIPMLNGIETKFGLSLPRFSPSTKTVQS